MSLGYKTIFTQCIVKALSLSIVAPSTCLLIPASTYQALQCPCYQDCRFFCIRSNINLSLSKGLVGVYCFQHYSLNTYILYPLLMLDYTLHNRNKIATSNLFIKLIYKTVFLTLLPVQYCTSHFCY